MTRRLDGKVAVITGATSGIGEATARLFAAESASLVIAGRAVDKGEALARELGPNVVFQRADVMREADIAALVDTAVARFGRLDCLFNNAGALDRSTLDSVTEEEFASTMKLLFGAVVFGIKHAARVMKPRHGGSIINNSSIAAHRAGQGGYLYSAAKAAVSHVTRLAGVELGAHGIRVNAISPGAISTPIFWGGSERAPNTQRRRQPAEAGEARSQPRARDSTAAGRLCVRHRVRRVVSCQRRGKLRQLPRSCGRRRAHFALL
jgi:NAD(P)-dependent dehydrogenase (short-subunit alcohol dehydrogenase family)